VPPLTPAPVPHRADMPSWKDGESNDEWLPVRCFPVLAQVVVGFLIPSKLTSFVVDFVDFLRN
jgi:hypothetical protein